MPDHRWNPKTPCPICSKRDCEHEAAVRFAFEKYGVYQIALLDIRNGEALIAERALPSDVLIRDQSDVGTDTGTPNRYQLIN